LFTFHHKFIDLIMAKVVILKSDSDSTDDYNSVLSAHKFQPIFISSLDFHYKNLNILADKLEKPNDYSGIIFTSPRSITATVEAIHESQLNDTWKDLKNYCVGPTSFAQLQKFLHLSPLGKDTGNASSLADFIKSDIKDCSITKPFLMPCGNLKQDILQTKLSDYGYSVEPVEVYETVPERNLEKNIENVFQDTAIEYIVFFSPSGINFSANIFNKLNVDLNEKKLIALGPSTKKTIENHGFKVYATAEKPSPESLVKVLTEL
jgi:uroporphyrinogen-III synthase